ncbi:MAG: type II toxin-antitoxin system VapB family antitoxin [Thermodesulfobacteriota bacterium]
MKIKIELDDELIEKAFKYCDAETKKKLIHQALIEFVENHSRKKLSDLKGEIKFKEDYDYKKMRINSDR